jgi:hypothetical protein
MNVSHLDVSPFLQKLKPPCFLPYEQNWYCPPTTSDWTTSNEAAPRSSSCSWKVSSVGQFHVELRAKVHGVQVWSLALRTRYKLS